MSVNSKLCDTEGKVQSGTFLIYSNKETVKKSEEEREQRARSSWKVEEGKKRQ